MMRRDADFSGLIVQNAENDPETAEIDRLLEAAGMSRRDLVDMLGVHRGTVSRWATGGEIPAAVRSYLELRTRVRDLGK